MEYYVEVRKDGGYIASEKVEARSALEAKEIVKGTLEFVIFAKAREVQNGKTD